MFTLAISFLIFAASSFTLLAGLIEGEVVTLFGSDLYVDSWGAPSGHYLNETALTAFLEEQQQFDGAVAGFGYISTKLNDLTEFIMDDDSYSQKLSDLTGYNLINIDVMAVPEEFLSLVDDNYYFPNSF